MSASVVAFLSSKVTRCVAQLGVREKCRSDIDSVH